MKNKFVFFSATFIFFSCSNPDIVNHSKWEIVKGKGINPDNRQFYFLFFQGKNYGLMFGSSYSDENILKRQFSSFEAVYYFSNDTGFTWVEKKLGKGKFSSYDAKNNYFVVCKELKGEKNKPDSTLIYCSNDYGNTFYQWGSLADFFIRNIFLKSENEFYVVGKRNRENYWTIRKISNRGNTWNDDISVENNLQSPIMVNNDILCLINRDNKNFVKKISLSSGVISEVQLPNEIGDTYFLTSYLNNVFLISSSAGNIRIYKVIEAHVVEFSQLVAADKFPVYMKIQNGRMYLILGERNSIGVIYSLYSKDLRSDSWDVTFMPSSNFYPFAFSESAIWGYSTGGQFYKKELLSP